MVHDISEQVLLRQCTVQAPVMIEGIGVHGARPVRVTISPLPAQSGIWMAIIRGKRCVQIPVLARYLLPFQLATCVGENHEFSVRTIEHLMSALYGLGIDNALITVEGDEIPIADGSSFPFAQALLRAGRHLFPDKKTWMFLKERRVFEDGDRRITFTPSVHPQLNIIFHVDFDHPMIYRQSYSFVLNPYGYTQEIARARTFGFLKDAYKLHSQGIALGACVDNTIILTDDGVLNDMPLRFSDEFVRHKVLDALGDIALSGAYVAGTIEYVRSGHGLNRELARWICEMAEGCRPECALLSATSRTGSVVHLPG